MGCSSELAWHVGGQAQGAVRGSCLLFVLWMAPGAGSTTRLVVGVTGGWCPSRALKHRGSSRSSTCLPRGRVLLFGPDCQRQTVPRVQACGAGEAVAAGHTRPYRCSYASHRGVSDLAVCPQHLQPMTSRMSQQALSCAHPQDARQTSHPPEPQAWSVQPCVWCRSSEPCMPRPSVWACRLRWETR